tara:strand:+ start:971 stop:1936 length:966 start_codon:yes stop_codon:yes gene_type:complete
MEFECRVCNRSFKNQAQLDRHLKTKIHLSKVTKATGVGEKKVPFAVTCPTVVNKYSIENIINRTDTDIRLPKQTWKKFINSAYHYDTTQGEDKLISSGEKHIEKAANLLITKLNNTPKEELPILLINKTSGANKRIAYYEGDPEFTVRTGVSKKDNVQLFNALDIYLSRSIGLLWYEPKLREIYRTLPIEIRNKVWFRAMDDDKISFLDFFCVPGECRHLACWSSTHYTDHKHTYYKYKNKVLQNVDGGKFVLDDDAYLEFRSDYAEHVINHEHYDTLIKFRKEQKDCYFSTEMCEIQSGVLEELFIQVCRICNINTILEE